MIGKRVFHDPLEVDRHDSTSEDDDDMNDIRSGLISLMITRVRSLILLTIQRFYYHHVGSHVRGRKRVRKILSRSDGDCLLGVHPLGIPAGMGQDGLQTASRDIPKPEREDILVQSFPPRTPTSSHRHERT